jgi:hypothetical protein
MARGWESKSVESQIEDSTIRSRKSSDTPLNEEQRLSRERVNSLSMSRTRLQQELQTCCNARFRAQLEQELAFVDAQLKKFS